MIVAAVNGRTSVSGDSVSRNLNAELAVKDQERERGDKSDSAEQAKRGKRVALARRQVPVEASAAQHRHEARRREQAKTRFGRS